MNKLIFTWDLGATKCTAGIVVCHSPLHYVCQQHVSIKLNTVNSLEELILNLEHQLNFKMSDADAVCIAAAGYFDGEKLILEGGYPYPMPFAQLAHQYRWPAFKVIHDYAPIVCATFTSYMTEAGKIKRLNDCELTMNGRRVAFGVGTGLGLKDGVLLDNGDFWLGENEMGHIGVTTPPLSDHYGSFHEMFIQFLVKQHSFAKHQALTFEKILSGNGTLRLCQFFYPELNLSTPEVVGAAMREGHIPEVQNAFAWYLGLFTGVVELSFMPEGGIWITGGVVLNHLDLFDNPAFFAGRKTLPAYREQRATYPLGVLCDPTHALIGCGYYAVKRLLPSDSSTLYYEQRSA